MCPLFGGSTVHKEEDNPLYSEVLLYNFFCNYLSAQGCVEKGETCLVGVPGRRVFSPCCDGLKCVETSFRSPTYSLFHCDDEKEEEPERAMEIEAAALKIDALKLEAEVKSKCLQPGEMCDPDVQPSQCCPPDYCHPNMQMCV